MLHYLGRLTGWHLVRRIEGTDGDHCFSLLRLCLLASLRGPYQEDHLMEMFCLGILDNETLIKLFKVEPLEI